MHPSTPWHKPWLQCDAISKCVRARLRLPACPAAMRQWAEAAISLVEAIAAERADGQPASVRTVRLCGTAGLVAFSMIGECPPA